MRHDSTFEVTLTKICNILQFSATEDTDSVITDRQELGVNIPRAMMIHASDALTTATTVM